MKKKFKRMTRDELFTYILFVQEFYNDLFVDYDGGSYMPDSNERIWYRFVDDILDKDLRLRECTEIEGESISKESLWQFLRQTWRGHGVEDNWAVACSISELWGPFERGSRGR